jgi:hypothetical protein
MSEFIVPFEERRIIAAPLDVPVDLYRGLFMDGPNQYKVIIDTDANPQMEAGSLYDDPIHEVNVYKTTLDGEGITREEVPSGEVPYPFTERVELTNMYVPLSQILEAYDEKNAE